jgi:hypothetical protein
MRKIFWYIKTNVRITDAKASETNEVSDNNS